MTQTKKKALAALLGAILAIIGLTSIWLIHNPYDEEPAHVFEEMSRTIKKGRRGPLSKAPHIWATPLNNNQESDGFQYYAYEVKEDSLPPRFESLSISMWPTGRIDATLVYEASDTSRVMSRYSYAPRSHPDTATFSISGWDFESGPNRDLSADEVTAALAEHDMTLADFQQLTLESVNSYLIDAWTEVYDSAFSSDDWGAITIVDEGLDE
ncbi:TipC family immunity protein [Trueperella bialowiezensis]|uniref:Uncharacterized protein n=1 Tax=Trueperella bialowiezensis TaxID=312285 RepID=A0A448PFA0_9ACTO|nr:TipC family immunity protein [Trueperella bialowiezensis]VEI13588.1 Uncharacterised protein [Trueperella bialowiezensis]